MCTCHQILIHVYFIHQIAQQSKDRARPSEDNDDRVQIHSTAPKKEDKKDTRCYNFYYKLYILNQQKIVHVSLCVEKNGTIIIFLFGFLLSVVICCTICSIISQRYTPLFSAKKNI